MPHSVAIRSGGTSAPVVVSLLFFVLLGVFADSATAQRPVALFDPFYRGESARRGFFDRYAVSGELQYRPARLLRSDASAGATAPGAADPLRLWLQLDYQLSERFDLGLYVDAGGGRYGTSMTLGWVALKYYRTDEFSDYAVRMAIDPSADGVSGFPQLDIAFLYATTPTPTSRTDWAFGVRRVAIGLQELMTVEPPPLDPDEPIVSPAPLERVFARTRAVGWEVHMTAAHNLIFDPAGSSLFVALLVEAGSYSLLEWVAASGIDDEPDPERTASTFRGGIVWMRTGLQIDRPAFRIAPFLAVPLGQWAPEEGTWPRERPRLGLRLTFR